MLIGWLRAGPAGAVAAWIGFTLPSAIVMTVAALALPGLDVHAGWLHGMLLVAAAVVASAIVTMRATLAPDGWRIGIALAVFAFMLLAPWGAAAPLAIAGAALLGLGLLRGRIAAPAASLDLAVPRAVAVVTLAVFAFGFLALALWAATGSHAGMLANTLYRVGSLVFGGGHVVLPLLETEVARAGIVPSQTVLAGYATAQAMPGPLFTIASYVGASAYDRSLGWGGALLGTVAIFAPSFFLLAGIAPFYRRLSSSARFRAALAGANAGVVGLLAAAFVTPIWRNAVHTWVDGLVVALAFDALHFAKQPAWAIVLLGAVAGFFLER
jgi:chromate transporter